ncbi:hypothetical protein CFP56_029485 [Quercus suber]|uniref:Uncharacterized protein n=1 Tax=Quercus suber TaxID=58331 RepID=A0AAW0JR66_QUESU
MENHSTNIPHVTNIGQSDSLTTMAKEIRDLSSSTEIAPALLISHTSMAKGIINLYSWIEVAPAPIMYPRKKPSNSPRLEPIAEEGAEEYDDDS